MQGKGIVFNANAGTYETNWGWMWFDFNTGDVRVHGPSVEEWFDADSALKTAGLFAEHSPSLGMALAIAIHMQYAAWKGMQGMPR